VWDAKTGKALGAPLTGHTNMIRSVAISPDGRHIVSGSNDYTIRVWDINTREALGAPLRGHSGSVHSIAISPDGKYVSCSLDGTIRVWDVEHQHSKARAICFSPNPTYALCSPFSFLRPSRDPASLSMNEEGWVMGPEGRLLLWIPISLYPLIYAPCNTLVISDFDISQLDLSRFAHGSAW
ncbi:WD40 repeat-like protein, partial [Rhizopogon salebrosus TDB-379]